MFSVLLSKIDLALKMQFINEKFGQRKNWVSYPSSGDRVAYIYMYIYIYIKYI